MTLTGANKSNMTTEDAIKSINRAIGVGDRKVTNKVINRPLVYPHKEQQK